MSTLIPAVPLLVEDAAMSKTVVETSPGNYALNTIGGSVSSWTPADVAEIIANTVYDDGMLNQFTVAESAHLAAGAAANIEAKTDLIATDVDALKTSVGETSDSDTSPTVIGLLKSIVAHLS